MHKYIDQKIAVKHNNNLKKISIGFNSAIAAAIFLGFTPIFGKQAIQEGFSPLVTVALRTLLASLFLFISILLLRPKYLCIYPVGLIGCALAGILNGIGSLFYYSALGRIDVSIGHLLYMLYPIFVAIWLWLDHQPPTRLTYLRLVVIIPGILLLIKTGTKPVDYIGVSQMLVASAFYALHLPVNQRVLYDMPAPTVTLYTLFAMSAVVIPGALIHTSPDGFWLNITSTATSAWFPLIGLSLVTFLSRVLLFMGVKHLGGMQTALLGLGEILITLILAFSWLQESFSLIQWLGTGLISISLILSAIDKNDTSKKKSGGWLSWISSSPIFNKIE